MRVVLAISDPARRTRLDARLRVVRGISPPKVASDLTETYHTVEHRPPGWVLMDTSLASRPECEVLLQLCVAVGTRLALVTQPVDGAWQMPAALRAAGIPKLDEAESDEVWWRTLFVSRPPVGNPTAPPTSDTSPGSQGPRAAAPDHHPAPGRLIMIGSSTGGVDALINVLRHFGPSCPPTFVVQHTGGAFSGGLARLLDGRTSAQVLEADDGMKVPPGTVVLAPGSDFHLHANLNGSTPRVRLVSGPDISGHRPAVNALFRSGLEHGKKIAAAILTGMGRDGAEGLLALRQAGARTFGQDAASSLVYGMPKVAAEIGAVETQMPLAKIGPALLSASAEQVQA
ncbi:MAG: CheB methylesterase domain-containing protein [Pseudomonadota bacterium]